MKLVHLQVAMGTACVLLAAGVAMGDIACNFGGIDHCRDVSNTCISHGCLPYPALCPDGSGNNMEYMQLDNAVAGWENCRFKDEDWALGCNEEMVNCGMWVAYMKINGTTCEDACGDVGPKKLCKAKAQWNPCPKF